MRIPRIHRSKRWWTVVGIIVALILTTVGYGIYSVSSWQAYEKRTVSWQKSTKQTLTKVLSLPSTSDTERNSKLTAFKAASRDMRQSQASICDPARLTGWQLSIDTAKTLREACGTYSQKVTSTWKHLDKAVAYLEDESKVLTALQPALALPKAVSEKDWDQTAATWGSVHTAVTSMTVSSSFTDTKTQIATVTAGIDTSWKELMVAHSKKDKASFVASITKLQKSYEAIASITSTNGSQLSTLSSELQSLYDKL